VSTELWPVPPAPAFEPDKVTRVREAGGEVDACWRVAALVGYPRALLMRASPT
jgi:hypothetical protein